jgi:molybdenum cofactor cytidylyltransferase
LNAGVILAAGEGTRMGFPKQIAEYKGETLIKQVTDLVSSFFDKVVVVLGYEPDLILDSTNFGSSELLINENWSEGIGSSLRTAIMHLENFKEIENLFLFLADQPDINSNVIEKLISSSDETREVLVPQYRYRIGYPICIPKNYWDKLSLSGTNVDSEMGQETLDPLSFIRVSDIAMKKIWFKYLNPIDIDQEKDR